MKNIRISNTNSSGKNDSAVRVYANNIIVVEVTLNQRNPLSYLLERIASKYLLKFRESLVSAMERELISYQDAKNIISETKLNIVI